MLVAAVAAVLTVALLGAGYALYSLRGTGDVLAGVVPGDTDVYVTVYLDPSASQKLNLKRLVGAFPQLEGVEQGGVQQVVNGFLSSVGSGLSFESDVQPWLGSQVAFAGRIERGTNGAVLIASKDDAAARRALAKFRKGPRGKRARWSEQSYQGVTISVGTLRSEDRHQVVVLAVVNHTVVVGSDAAFVRRVVDTATGHGKSLASSDVFGQAIDGLPGDRLALGYVYLPTAMAGLLRDVPGGASNVPGGAAALSLFRGMGVSISAEPDGISVDLHVSMDPSKVPAGEGGPDAHPNPALDAVPRGAYGVYAFEGVNRNLQASLSQALLDPSLQKIERKLALSQAVAALTGDGAFEVGPGGRYPAGALLLGSSNDPAVGAFLGRLGDMLSGPLGGKGRNPSWRSATYRGVKIRTLRVPALRKAGVAPSYAVADGLAVVASSPAELRRVLDARASGTNLPSSPTYRAATSHVDTSGGALLFVDLGNVAKGVRAGLPAQERARFDTETGSWLRHLKAVALSQSAGGAGYSMRMFVLIG
jgi:hypothetical protein